MSPSPPGAGGHHRGPAGGGDPTVSGVLPSLLLPRSLPHAPPAPLPGSPPLHPQLPLFLPPCQPRGAAPAPVLPAPPLPHVQRSRYGVRGPSPSAVTGGAFSASFPLSCAEIIPVYGMSNFIGREDAYSKPQPKKMKEPRQPDRQNRLNSPPSTLYKGGMGTAYNGYR